MTVSYDICAEDAGNEQQAEPSNDVNLILLDADSTSGIPGYPADDVIVTSSSPLQDDITGVTAEPAAAVDDVGETGTLVDLDEQASPAMTDSVVNGIPRQTGALDDSTASVCSYTS